MSELIKREKAVEIATEKFISNHVDQINNENKNGEFVHRIYVEKNSPLPIDALIAFVGSERDVVDERPVSYDTGVGAGEIKIITRSAK